MTHSYRKHFFHLIWSTKKRLPLISPELQRLYPYMIAIAKDHTGSVLDIGGMPDHAHLLIELSSLDKFSHLIRDLKASSSLWVHKTFPNMTGFAWQEGYGSFSVSFSALNTVKTYIQNQDQHHATMTFEEEYLKFLNLHHITFDDRFVLG